MNKIKGNNIFWDLDGVLRDLSFRWCGSIPTWTHVDSHGNGICEYIDKNLDDLVNAPPCEYLDLALLCEPLHVVSAQSDLWRPYTSAWTDKYVPEARVKYINNMEDKMKYLESGRRILIDDYPFYPDYTHIILIDRSYNQDTISPRRAHNPEELITYIEEFVNGK